MEAVLGRFRETVRTQGNANQELLESKVRLNAIKMTLEILRTRNAILKFPPVEAFARPVSRNFQMREALENPHPLRLRSAGFTKTYERTRRL